MARFREVVTRWKSSDAGAALTQHYPPGMARRQGPLPPKPVRHLPLLSFSANTLPRAANRGEEQAPDGPEPRKGRFALHAGAAVLLRLNRPVRGSVVYAPLDPGFLAVTLGYV